MTSVAIPLGDGIHRITLALPMLRPESVNCYVVEGDDGLTLIDWRSERRAELESLVARLGDISGGAVALDRLICTHLHFDHMGGAHTLVSRHPVEFVMHRSTADRVESYNDRTAGRSDLRKLARAHGALPSQLDPVEAVWTRRSYRGIAMRPSHPVVDGERIRVGSGRYLEVITTPGHDYTHICLRDSRSGYLFSGDHVLPRITPFIPYDPDRDSLAEYLAGLELIEDLDPAVTLPGHGETIDRGRASARQIALHHEGRLGALSQVVKGRPATAWEMTTEVFRPDPDPFDKMLAFLETMSHLEYLVNRGRLRRSLDDGVWRYVR